MADSLTNEWDSYTVSSSSGSSSECSTNCSSTHESDSESYMGDCSSFETVETSSNSTSDSDDTEDSLIPYTREALYQGANITKVDSHLLILEYSVSNSLTTKGLTDVLQLVNAHLPRCNSAPKSVYQLKKFFLTEREFSDVVVSSVPYCYCSRCHQLLTDDECTNGCNVESNEFLLIPVSSQLKRRLEGILVI